MLRKCAPGFTTKETDHHIWIGYNGKTFRGFPTGAHGSKDPEIQVGIIKQLVRLLEIDTACAKKHLGILTNRL